MFFEYVDYNRTALIMITLGLLALVRMRKAKVFTYIDVTWKGWQLGTLHLRSPRHYSKCSLRSKGAEASH